MSELKVQLVAADRRVWSGTATLVIARTTEGDMGILPGHEPVLAALADGVVTVRVAGGEDQVAAVHGGFLSVQGEEVIVLAEMAELGDEIDVERARRALERAKTEGASGEPSETILAAERRAETRLFAAESHLRGAVRQ